MGSPAHRRYLPPTHQKWHNRSIMVNEPNNDVRGMLWKKQHRNLSHLLTGQTRAKGSSVFWVSGGFVSEFSVESLLYLYMNVSLSASCSGFCFVLVSSWNMTGF
eukprot:scpid105867/ scgid13620/ 